MEFFILYLFVSIEKISSAIDSLGSYSILAATAIASSIIVIPMFTCTYANEMSEKFKLIYNNNKHAVCGLFILGIMLKTFSSIIPTREEVAMIIGGGVTYNILTSQQAKEIGGKSLELLNNKLQELIDESSKKKESVTDIEIKEEST